jgi:Methyltransferase domain
MGHQIYINKMNKSYILNLKDAFNKDAAGQSLIHLINLLCGQDCVGAEVGLLKAETFCLILQNCPGIKKMYGIDSWKPWVDELTFPGYPSGMTFDEADNAFVKAIAYYNIQYQSGCPEKAVILEEDSSTAVKKIADGELDFVFLDAYSNYDQAFREMRDWYPKVKSGGIVAGHDWYSDEVQRVVKDFFDEYKISSRLSLYDCTFAWIKE